MAGEVIVTRGETFLLREKEVLGDLGLLEAAWAGSRTFAFVPEKTGAGESWILQKCQELPEDLKNDHFILLTSGSTGRPKLVVGKKTRAQQLIRVLHDLQKSQEVGETICLLPLTYCFAFVNQWLWAREHGRDFHLNPGFGQPDRLHEALKNARKAMICLVGAQLSLLEKFLAGSIYPGVIRIHFAGGRFPQEKLADLKKIFPAATVFNNYGCAEAMPRLTLRAADAAAEAAHIGWPLPGVEMKADQANRILFRSPYSSVALVDDSGFLQVDESTWIPSGDLGRRSEDGHWELLGREGEVFKRFGEKISVPQILTLVRNHWDGRVEYYRATDPQGEAGYVLVLSPEPGENKVRDLLKEISRYHPRAAWPLRVESLENFPLLPNGKINREELARQSDLKVHWRQRL